jgi:hypothetical protein
MNRQYLLLLVGLLGALLLDLTGSGACGQTPKGDASRAEAATFFELKIRPALAGSCVKCHGEKKAKGGLRLDSRAGLLKGGDSGPAIVPGNPEKSLLIHAVRGVHEDIKMPPDKQLPGPVVAALARWIKNGAVWPEGMEVSGPARTKIPWAFQPVMKASLPSDPDGWAVQAVDRFIRQQQRTNGVEPAAQADRHTLLRRAAFSLTGLTPAPEEIDAFIADRAPGAWARVVERLLASPRYGERWGRHWLDVVRYADTGGFEADHLYPDAWRYRDYVIHSFNSDKPFDRFIQEQVAGDELRRDAVHATGLYCVGPVQGESAMVSKQLEYEWLTDAADTTGAALLGLTFGCARCHDHKYDPINQEDYYGMQAIFAASDRPYPAKVRLLRIKALNGLLSEAPVPKKLLHDPRCTLQTGDKVGLRLFHRPRPLAIHRLRRGELGKPAEEVGPAFPAALVQGNHKAAFVDVPPAQRRAALARWLTSPGNPLTARVLVNRVWGWHFGQALVRTPNDFGNQGEPPTHPALLDWLARDFMDHGWSLKHLHRRILLSRTYRMKSVARGRGLEIDRENRLVWHFPRHRLEGEAIRDRMLACAGTLNATPFGPPIVPPLGREELTGLFDARAKWPVTKDASQHTRRSVYLLVRRTFVYPLFAAFDPPEVMTSCACRGQTIVPTQALTLLNSPLAREQSAAFARRLLRACGHRPKSAVLRGWRLAFGRPITAAECEQAVSFLEKRTAALTAADRARKQAVPSARQAALAELCLALFNANEFLYVD